MNVSSDFLLPVCIAQPFRADFRIHDAFGSSSSSIMVERSDSAAAAEQPAKLLCITHAKYQEDSPSFTR
jgi:hypothetical protein